MTTMMNNDYMPTIECLRHDWSMVIVIIVLNATIAVEYVLIGMFWAYCSRKTPDSPGKKQLTRLRNIFVFCGLNGYVFMILRMWWPWWHLYLVTMSLLVFWTTKFLIDHRKFEAVFNELSSAQVVERVKSVVSQAPPPRSAEARIWLSQIEAALEGFNKSIDEEAKGGD